MSELNFISESLRPLAVEIDKLHIDPANARTKHALNRIAASLQQYGQRKPIVANRAQDGKIEAGNGTFLAAKKLNWTHIAVVWVDDDAATAAAFGIADNRVGELSEWDPGALAQLQSVTGDMFTGFEGSELAEILGTQPTESAGGDTEPQIDKAEELRQKWNVELGQMWQLGEHRIICGDCTDRAVVERVMGGENGQICFTSPPYNLGENIAISNRFQALKDSGSAYQGGEDDLDESAYLELLIGFTENALQFNQYAFVNIQSLAGNKVSLIDYVHHFKKRFADVAIWHKTNQQPAMAENVMNSSFEYIYIFSSDDNPTRAIKTGNFRGTFSNVYTSTINNNEFSDVHGAAFPLDFSSHFISNFTSVSGVVYEPFGGTGTTLIACENLSRRCRAVEISPAYVAVAIQRWAEHTGKEPILMG